MPTFVVAAQNHILWRLQHHFNARYGQGESTSWYVTNGVAGRTRQSRFCQMSLFSGPGQGSVQRQGVVYTA